MQPILIQGAMLKEIENIISKLKNMEIRKFCGITFYEGTIDYIPIVIEKTGIGLINTAMATTIAINNYDPKIIINQGCAGACTPVFHIGDIIIGENCININSNKTPNLKEKEGSNSLKWELYNFYEDEQDYQLNENNKTIENKTIKNVDLKLNTYKKIKSDQYLIEALKIDGNRSSSWKDSIYFGTIGSGDIWDNEYDRIELLNKKYNVLCEDMESIAAYTICEKLNVPILGIRMISNNKLINEEYNNQSLEKLKDFQEKIVEIIKII